MANYYEQCRTCGSYSSRNPCYDCLEKERDLYKRAFDEVCHQFNYSDDNALTAMKESFLTLAKKEAKAAKAKADILNQVNSRLLRKIPPELIPRIEKALGVTLTKSQIARLTSTTDEAYLRGGDRGSGKTFAYCIELALSEGPSLNISRPEEFCDPDYGTEKNRVKYAREYFRRMFFDVWAALKSAGFPVRPICDSKGQLIK